MAWDEVHVRSKHLPLTCHTGHFIPNNLTEVIYLYNLRLYFNGWCIGDPMASNCLSNTPGMGPSTKYLSTCVLKYSKYCTWTCTWHFEKESTWTWTCTWWSKYLVLGKYFRKYFLNNLLFMRFLTLSKEVNMSIKFCEILCCTIMQGVCVEDHNVYEVKRCNILCYN